METLNSNQLSTFANMSIEELQKNAKELKEYLLVMEAKQRADSPDAVWVSEKEAFKYLKEC